MPHVEELALNAGAKVIFLQVIEPGSIILGPEGSHLALDTMELDRRTQVAKDYLAGSQGEFREKAVEAQVCHRVDRPLLIIRSRGNE